MDQQCSSCAACCDSVNDIRHIVCLTEWRTHYCVPAESVGRGGIKTKNRVRDVMHKHLTKRPEHVGPLTEMKLCKTHLWPATFEGFLVM